MFISTPSIPELTAFRPLLGCRIGWGKPGEARALKESLDLLRNSHPDWKSGSSTKRLSTFVDIRQEQPSASLLMSAKADNRSSKALEFIPGYSPWDSHKKSTYEIFTKSLYRPPASLHVLYSELDKMTVYSRVG